MYDILRELHLTRNSNPRNQYTKSVFCFREFYEYFKSFLAACQSSGKREKHRQTVGGLFDHDDIEAYPYTFQNFKPVSHVRTVIVSRDLLLFQGA